MTALLDVLLVVLGAAFLCALVRVALGPSLADRAVAADACLFVVVAGLGILSLRIGARAFLDVVLVATLLGYIAAVSLARLIDRREREEARDQDEGPR